MVEPSQGKLTTREQVEAFLKAKGIDFHVSPYFLNLRIQTTTHPPVFTMAEMLEKVKFEGEELAATLFAKNLFYKSKKSQKGKEYVLVLAAHDTKFDSGRLASLLGHGSGGLRPAKAEDMKEILGVESGEVNIFSILNDKEKRVQVVVDKRLMAVKRVGFHPMQNDATTSIPSEVIN